MKLENIASEIEAEIRAILSLDLCAYEAQLLNNASEAAGVKDRQSAVHLGEVLSTVVELHKILRSKA